MLDIKGVVVQWTDQEAGLLHGPLYLTKKIKYH